VQWLVQASVVVRLHQSVIRMPDVAIRIDPSPGRLRPQGVMSLSLTETGNRVTIASVPEMGRA